MPIRVTCPNCGKQFSAWDDLLGKMVQCPKCKQQTILGGPNPQLDPPPSAPDNTGAQRPGGSRPGDSRRGDSGPSGSPPAAEKPRPGAKSPGEPRPPSHHTSRAAAHPSPTAPSPTAPSPPAPSPLAPRPATSPALPTQPVAGGPKRAPAPTVPKLAGDDSIPLGCPKCNAPMEPNDDLCDACGYHLILKKVIDISDMKRKNRGTGFERMLEGQLHESESSQNVLLWAKIAGAGILLVVFILCLGRWWWIGVLAVAAGSVLYWTRFRRRAAAADDGEKSVNEDPLAGAVWSLLLGCQRIVGWRRMQWPFSSVKSLTLTDPSFHDDEIPDLTGLAELEALDIEGTGVTDTGLQHLRELKQLKFLVLRRTQVTPGGVQRLQRDLPQTMIWQ